MTPRTPHNHRRSSLTGSFSPEYNSWRGMIQRCTNPKHVKYANYGGRGITITPRWQGQDGFIHFLEDMGPRPAGKTLDRRDANLNYEKDNCVWSDLSTQNKNQRRWFRQKSEALFPESGVVGSDDQEDGKEQGGTDFDF